MFVICDVNYCSNSFKVDSRLYRYDLGKEGTVSFLVAIPVTLS